MPHIPLKLFLGRALPALFISCLVIIMLPSCSRDKGPQGPPADAPVAGGAVSSRPETVGQGPVAEDTLEAGPAPSGETPDEATARVAQALGQRTPARAAADSREEDAFEPGPEDEFEASMGRREGGHFLVRFEGGENAVAGHLIGLLLEEAYLKVGSDLGHYPDERIEALLYSQEAFRDITRSPAWAGAIYDGRIKLPAGGITEKTAALEKVIYHEYTHAVVRELSGGRAPLWLNEGIAQYEEGQRSAPHARALAALSAKGALRLRPLEGSFMGLRQREAQAAYLMSLSAVEYLVREFGLFTVRSILERLAEGEGLDEAISASLGISYDELEARWAASVAD